MSQELEIKNLSKNQKTLYLSFNVTTAITTDMIVTIQNRTAILLSWYPNF